jgi:asparagine synthase (glutamine-hydrolysing)
VGLSLTGGLDGRMIMACNGHASGALPCYTFGGTYRDCTDVTYARQVAQRCGQPHQVIPVDDRFLAQFAELAEKSVYVSDGAMDVTGSVELFANRLARDIAPVRMTGNYGSEILRNNVAFKPQALNPRLFSPEFVKLGEMAAATYEQEARGKQLSLIVFKQVP